MKNFKFLLAFVLLTAVLAVSAFATVSINFDVEETTAGSVDCYKVVVTQTDDEGDWRALQTKIAFNYDKIIPIDWCEGVVPSYVGEEAEYPFVFGSFKSGRTSTAELTRPGAPEWTINGADSEVVVELSWGYLDTFPITANNSFIYEMYFKLADGVELTDIYADDFNVYYVKYANGVDNFYGHEEESKNNLVLTNNVVNEAPVVSEDWVAGAGYLIDGAASATTKTKTSATKVYVSHGGYYATADSLAGNWGGVASKEKVTVDGLEIEVAYTSVPETDNDRWMYIGVLDNPSIFIAGTPYNPGYVNLIRYGEDRMEAYGTDTWAKTGVYGKGTGFFAIKADDVLRVCFAKNAQGTYDVTYIKNNTELLEGPKGLALSETAHVVVSASCKNSPKDAFAYTVDTDPAALEIAKLPVKAGDVVYKAGSKIAPVAFEAAGTYKFVVTAANAGTYVVNTGYTAQKVYEVSVADGVVVESDLENGVLGSNSVAMREVDPQGIRFFGTVTQDVRKYADLVEYGFIMTAESAYNALGNNYVLDMDLVSNNKAKKGVAYNRADLDKYHELDDEKIVIAGVLHGIPEDAAGFKTVIASRPYYKLSDGTYVYGETTKASLYQIAKKIYGDGNYAASQEYAKKIIEIVDGSLEEPEEPEEPENETIIDVGSLYR